MERYEYAIWGIYGDDSSESLLATKNKQGEFISSKAEALEIIESIKQAVNLGKFHNIRDVRIQAINMNNANDVNSMFIGAISK